MWRADSLSEMGAPSAPEAGDKPAHRYFMTFRGLYCIYLRTLRMVMIPPVPHDCKTAGNFRLRIYVCAIYSAAEPTAARFVSGGRREDVGRKDVRGKWQGEVKSRQPLRGAAYLSVEV